MNILTQSNTQSMTSQQIAELVDSRHDVVRKSIERLVARGVIQLPPTTEVKLNQSLSPNSKTVVYVFSGEQGKRDSYVVVAQLSPEFTGALVDRWQELEQQVSASSPVTPALPDFTDPYESALAWAEQYKAKEIAQAQVVELKPKADALDALSHIKGSLGIRETAKAVGIPEREFVRRCLGDDKPVSSRFMYRDKDGKLNAHAHRIKQGFMSQKITSYQGKNGLDLVTIKVKFTAAGVAHIAKMMQNKPVKQLRVM